MSQNRSAPSRASLVIEKSINKTGRCIIYVKGLNQSTAFLSKKSCGILSCPLFFFCLPLPKRLNCWLIFVSQLNSLPLALRLLPLILTRLLTPKSEDPSSLASGNELVRWAVRFIAHEAGVSLCACVRVYRGWMSVCVCARVCVNQHCFHRSWNLLHVCISLHSAWTCPCEGAKCWIYTVSQCVYMYVLIFFMFDGRTHYAKRCFLILINLCNNKSCLSCKLCWPMVFCLTLEYSWLQTR